MPRTAAWASRAMPSSNTANQTIQLGPPGPVLRASRTSRQPRNSGGKQLASDARDKDKRRMISALPVAPAAARSQSPPLQPVPKLPGPSTAGASSQNTAPVEPTSSTAASPQLTSSAAASEPASAVTSPQSSHAQMSAVPGLAAPPGLAPPLTSIASENISSPKDLVAPAPLHAPPGLIRLPPGLNVPPDQRPPMPTRPYHLSKHAQALIDDVRMRREAVMAATTPPPIFPDFDRTLENLVNSAGFSFSFANVMPPPPDPGLPTLRTTRKTTFDPFASPLDRIPTSSGSSPALGSVGMGQRRGSFAPFTDDSAIVGDSGGRSRFDFARRQASLGATRDAQPYGQLSRGTTPFRPEATSGNTLYSSNDAGYISRQQGSWNSYQSSGSSINEYRYQGSVSGSQFQSPPASGPEAQPYGEMLPTPFDQVSISDNIRELVRGFDTLGMENATGRQFELGQQNFLGLPPNRSSAHYISGAPMHGSAFSYQMQSAHVDPRVQPQPTALLQRSAGDEIMSQGLNMRSPLDGSVYSQYPLQSPPGPAPSTTHQQNAPLNPTPNVLKELTSSNGELHRVLIRGRVY